MLKWKQKKKKLLTFRQVITQSIFSVCDCQMLSTWHRRKYLNQNSGPPRNIRKRFQELHCFHPLANTTSGEARMTGTSLCFLLSALLNFSGRGGHDQAYITQKTQQQVAYLIWAWRCALVSFMKALAGHRALQTQRLSAVKWITLQRHWSEEKQPPPVKIVLTKPYNR